MLTREEEIILDLLTNPKESPGAPYDDDDNDPARQHWKGLREEGCIIPNPAAVDEEGGDLWQLSSEGEALQKQLIRKKAHR